MSDNFYDDPDLAVPEGSFVKWDEPKTVVGTIKSRSKGTDYDGKPAAVFSIEQDDGEVVSVTASTYRLKKESAEQKWNVGDRVAIQYLGTEDLGGGRSVKNFEVETKKAEAVSASKPSSLLG